MEIIERWLMISLLYTGAVFIFYRAWSLKDLSKCLPASFCVIFALAVWPFFIPMKICLLAAYVVAVLFLPVFWYKGLLKQKRVLWIYGMLAFFALVYVVMTRFVLPC